MTEKDNVTESFITQKRRDLLRLNRVRYGLYALITGTGFLGTQFTEAVSVPRAASVVTAGIGIAATLGGLLHRPSTHGGSDSPSYTVSSPPSPTTPGLELEFPEFIEEIEHWLSQQTGTNHSLV